MGVDEVPRNGPECLSHAIAQGFHLSRVLGSLVLGVKGGKGTDADPPPICCRPGSGKQAPGSLQGGPVKLGQTGIMTLFVYCAEKKWAAINQTRRRGTSKGQVQANREGQRLREELMT